MMTEHIRWAKLVESELPMAEELEMFDRVQSSLAGVCEAHASHSACMWYLLDDLQIVRMVTNSRMSPVPFT
jgi:hypothetical protein